MSAFALTLARPHRLRIIELVVELVAGLHDGLRIARRYRELEAMNDAELAAIGLTRNGIALAAVRSVE